MCNRVSARDVEKVFSKHPQATLQDVKRITSASASCGRCRSELEAFVKKIRSKQPDAPPSPQLTIPFDFS
ncbi:(2Fe-2S)-binding protein [Marinilabilia sp.]